MRESSHVATTDPPELPGGWIPLLGSQCSLGLSEALPSIPWKGTSHMSEIVWEGALPSGRELGGPNAPLTPNQKKRRGKREMQRKICWCLNRIFLFMHVCLSILNFNHGPTAAGLKIGKNSSLAIFNLQSSIQPRYFFKFFFITGPPPLDWRLAKRVPSQSSIFNLQSSIQPR